MSASNKVAVKVTFPKSILQKARGLMFQDKIEPMLIKTRFGIHTFFVRKAIDVVILDNNYKVVKIRKNMKPWRLFFYNPIYQNVLELPSGITEQLKIKPESTVQIQK